MNRDQIKGKAKDIAGKVQQKVGEAIHSSTQQVKGVGKQVVGKVQKATGDANERLKEAEKKTRS
jgi:uncharacterized protein YjbJ (UPF0337 family)